MTGKGSSNCGSCVNYVYDDLYGSYVCDVNLDEDELIRFMTYSNFNCPYFQYNDEYKIVRKQM